MLLADAGAPVAKLCTGTAEQLRGRRQPAHPTGREGAEIGAIHTEPDAEVLKLLMAAPFHADHVVGAAVADLRAGSTSLKTVLHVRVGCLIVVMHNAPLAVICGGRRIVNSTQKADHNNRGLKDRKAKGAVTARCSPRTTSCPRTDTLSVIESDFLNTIRDAVFIERRLHGVVVGRYIDDLVHVALRLLALCDGFAPHRQR